VVSRSRPGRPRPGPRHERGRAGAPWTRDHDGRGAGRRRDRARRERRRAGGAAVDRHPTRDRVHAHLHHHPAAAGRRPGREGLRTADGGWAGRVHVVPVPERPELAALVAAAADRAAVLWSAHGRTGW